MGSIIAREGDQVVFEAFSSIPPLRTDALIKHATINAGSDMRLVTVAKVWGILFPRKVDETRVANSCLT